MASIPFRLRKRLKDREVTERRQVGDVLAVVETPRLQSQDETEV